MHTSLAAGSPVPQHNKGTKRNNPPTFNSFLQKRFRHTGGGRRRTGCFIVAVLQDVICMCTQHRHLQSPQNHCWIQQHNHRSAGNVPKTLNHDASILLNGIQNQEQDCSVLLRPNDFSCSYGITTSSFTDVRQRCTHIYRCTQQFEQYPHLSHQQQGEKPAAPERRSAEKLGPKQLREVGWAFHSIPPELEHFCSFLNSKLQTEVRIVFKDSLSSSLRQERKAQHRPSPRQT